MGSAELVLDENRFGSGGLAVSVVRVVVAVLVAVVGMGMVMGMLLSMMTMLLLLLLILVEEGKILEHASRRV